jgi:hypothetical protein
VGALQRANSVSRQISPLQELREVLGEVSTASVATGVLGVGGNKGAVAIGFTLHRRRLAFLASHFAAHQARPCSSTMLLLPSSIPVEGTGQVRL